MSTAKIKLTSEEMRYIALFENMTGATVNDCIIDNQYDRIIFVTKQGEIGIAIGKGGKNVNMLRKITGRPIEVVEYADTPEGLIRNCLSPAKIKEMRVSEQPNRKVVVLHVDQKDKALAIGKNGKTIDKTRMLAKRYYGVDQIQIM